jgi:hypothetical protein
MARTVVTRRDQLIRLGLAKRRPRPSKRLPSAPAPAPSPQRARAVGAGSTLASDDPPPASRAA